jgi:WD40 repeat protein
MFLSKSERNERFRNRSRYELLGERVVANLQVTDSFAGHKSCVNTLRWSDDGRFLFSGSDDTKIGVWELYPDCNKSDRTSQKSGADRTLKHHRFVETTHRDFIFDLAQVPLSDGELMISIAKDASVCLSNIERGATERGLNLPSRGNSGGTGSRGQHMGYRCMFLQDPNVFLATTSRAVELIDCRTLTSVNHWTIPGGPSGDLVRDVDHNSGITSISALPRSSSTAFVVASNPSRGILFFDLRHNSASASNPIHSGCDPLGPLGASEKDWHDAMVLSTSGIAFNGNGTKLARYKMLHCGLELFDVDCKGSETDRGNYWRPIVNPKGPRTLGADSVNSNTFLKHPVFFGAEGNRFVAAPTDNGSIVVYDTEAPTISLGNFRWLKTVNVIADCDGRICNVACPHPFYDQTPIIAASGLDSSIKLIQPVFGADQRFLTRLADTRAIRRQLGPAEAVKLVAGHIPLLTAEKQRIADLIKDGKHYEAVERTRHLLSGIRAEYWAKMETQDLDDETVEGDGKLSPDSVPILVALLNNAALCAQQLKSPSLVIGCCDLVIGWQPGNAKAHFRRATALDQLQDYEGAIQSATEAQKLVGGPGKDAAVDQLLANLQPKLRQKNQKLKNAMRGLFE